MTAMPSRPRHGPNPPEMPLMFLYGHVHGDPKVHTMPME